MRFIIFLMLLSVGVLAESFYVQHARTEEERIQGLMGVKELPENTGMLFHFPREGRYAFWGWGCYLDLGIAYLDKNGQVLEIAHLETLPTDEAPDGSHPFVNKSYLPRSKSSYVLEMQWSWFKKIELSTGDQIQINPNGKTQEIRKYPTIETRR